ncbi:3-isopropylmalate dehydrogenase [Caldanaerovirga acetigignens]|uniref:3-isopropylmalate dehydrogenase n=1 Tax=Caldanaerovirga acetigignens TaxID=447595 RepID=A0A1M7IRH1_9FIRM|nr:3-isopropylmalate dehydrogenase [Caldanaerovirga acetigignens]SHM43213.1 3-isopropylmalate dehydrogenase [Caldanaerovirga acetigignens]
MKIAVIPGDGIGPEVVGQAIVVLEAVAQKFGHRFEFQEALLGGAALDVKGVPLPDETMEICLKSDAVLLGAVGGPKWDNLPGHLRPEAGLLGIRKGLNLFANLRPAKVFPQLKSNSTLKEEALGEGIDILVVRELTGDIYFGEKGRAKIPGGEKAWDTAVYTTYEVERVAHLAFRIARGRRRKVTSVDKANVLESSRLWREVVSKVGEQYNDVELNLMYVDNAAMQLIKNPHQFDVILTTNMFGDILSDEAAMLTGSLGMLPSASLGEGRLGLYEPVHGSAPDIAGQDKANPIATILSAAMMLRYSFYLEEEAQAVENAVSKVLDQGYRTSDIATPGAKIVGTKEMGSLIAQNM